jgi:hypothetical protein
MSAEREVQLNRYKYGVKGESKGQGKKGRSKEESRRGEETCEDERVGTDSKRKEKGGGKNKIG